MSTLSRSAAVMTTVAIAIASACAAMIDAAVAAQSRIGNGATLAQVAASPPPRSNAQRSLRLNPEEKKKILADLATESIVPAAAEVQASVGTKIPSSVALHPLPTAVATDVPVARNYSYAKLHDDAIVIVDPKDRVVADVIPAQSTTGSE